MSPTLALIPILLGLWLVLPLPFAVLLGKCIRAAEVGDAARWRTREQPEAAPPLTDAA